MYTRALIESEKNEAVSYKYSSFPLQLEREGGRERMREGGLHVL